MTARTTMVYQNGRQLEKGLKAAERQGWRVVSTSSVDMGYGCLKTGCLGVIFFPLALLGKKRGKTIVTYEMGGYIG